MSSQSSMTAPELAKRDLWQLASDLALIGEPEDSKLANLVHYAWQEAYERVRRDQAPRVEP